VLNAGCGSSWEQEAHDRSLGGVEGPQQTTIEGLDPRFISLVVVRQGKDVSTVAQLTGTRTPIYTVCWRYAGVVVAWSIITHLGDQPTRPEKPKVVIEVVGACINLLT